MTGVIAAIPKFQFSSATGAPLANGKLTVYVAGSTTPTNTWQDSALTIANTNPVTLDSRGECVLWLSSTVQYKFVLKNAAGLIQWTQDNISGAGALADQLRTSLSASTGASIVGFIPAGGGAVASTVQQKLRITAADPEALTKESSVNGAYAAVSVNFIRTVINRHAFEDWSVLNTTDTNQGYSSFDSKATLNNSLAQGHFVGYQARNIYTGSAGITGYMHGFNTAMVHSGAGTIAKMVGLNIDDVGGSGTISVNQGVYIATLTRGASNNAIYSDAGNAHMLGGPTGTVFTGTIQAAGFNYNNDNVSKTLTFGFGTAGQTQFGTINFYNGKSGIVVQIQSNGIAVTGVVNASGPTKAGSYTVATLPSSTEGYTAYATNGCKVGEGVGAGTGVPVYYSGGVWIVFSTDAVVLA